ncbi:MAG: diacylglycerol/lipid kinase family protein [Chloroflexota bacterium]
MAIVNPAAGAGRGPVRWRHVDAALAGLGIVADVQTTQYPGHAELLAADAARGGYGTVLAVGGDGTVHEVVNGLAVGGLEHAPVLGVVPAGTGMDFARNIGLPRRVPRIAKVISAGCTARVDVGESESDGRLFLNFAETGLGAAVVAREAQLSNGWPGRVSFLLAAISSALRDSNISAKITVDGDVVYSGPLVSAVVANGRYFGGGMKIAPLASVTDGELDVLILGDFSRAQLIAQIWKIYPGTHLHHHKVLWLRGQQIRIEPRSLTQLDLDGELGGAGPYSLIVRPGALRVLLGGTRRRTLVE